MKNCFASGWKFNPAFLYAITSVSAVACGPLAGLGAHPLPSLSLDIVGSADADMPIQGSDETLVIDDSFRYIPTARPSQPLPQKPAVSTTQNVDTGRPLHEWQRLTDDWGGLRPRLDDHGISINSSLATYAGMNLVGGPTVGGGFSYLFNFNITLDTDKLFRWKGGTFFVNFRNQNGLQESRDGAIQTTSDLYIPARTQISELWYEQSAFEDKFTFRFGKIDANTQFAVNAYGEDFLNSSVGVSPNILFMPTDPDPAVGFDLFLHPCDHFYLGLGLFDGSLARGVSTGSYGPSNLFSPPSSLFLISEAGAGWELTASHLAGHAAVGVWYHTGDFPEYSGSSRSGIGGEYFVLNQQLWRSHPQDEEDTSGIASFARYAYADPDVSEIEHQFSAGLVWNGLCAARPMDSLGVGVNWAHLSEQAPFARHDEIIFEAFYKCRPLKWLSVKPDLQYIVNTDGAADSALAAVIEIVIDF